jgi:hypothetical protein
MPRRCNYLHDENCWAERVQREARAETAPAGRLAANAWHHYQPTGLEPDDIEGGSPLKLVVAEIYRSGVTETHGGEGAWRERLLKEVNLEQGGASKEKDPFAQERRRRREAEGSGGRAAVGSPDATSRAAEVVEPPWYHEWTHPDDRWTRKGRGYAAMRLGMSPARAGSSPSRAELVAPPAQQQTPPRPPPTAPDSQASARSSKKVCRKMGPRATFLRWAPCLLANACIVLACNIW